MNQKRFKAVKVIRLLVFIPLSPSQRGGHFSPCYPVRPTLLDAGLVCQVAGNIQRVKSSPHAISQHARHISLNVSTQPLHFLKHTGMHQRHALLVRVACEDGRQRLTTSGVHRRLLAEVVERLPGPFLRSQIDVLVKPQVVISTFKQHLINQVTGIVQDDGE
ncbi:hypothetical protein SDC9_143411 [bioreactor metagenome]|uniref:Uncharacterized protein n=1 Tax=bioreactor metagenome TaxID=1076179 RepID=A0A645E621_9ZZZZ